VWSLKDTANIPCSILTNNVLRVNYYDMAKTKYSVSNIFLFSFLYLILFYSTVLNAQVVDVDSLWRNSAPKLYIQDETGLDLDYIKSEIIFVNYVRERKDADIHLIITYQITASGGKEYSLTFEGMGSFHDIGYILKQTTQPDATDDEIRKLLVASIKRGLVSYIAHTDLRNNLNIEFAPPSAPTAVCDPWRNWVFSASLYGYATGVKSYLNLCYDLYPEIRRVTENDKLDICGGVSVNQRRFENDGTVDTYTTRSYYGDAFYAQKLSNHLSAGGWIGYQTSDYNNIQLGLSAAPKFEYNLVSYSEYVRHKVFIQFAPITVYRSYFDTTIYNLMNETKFRNELLLGVIMTRPWGTIDVSIGGSHYLHDFSKNRLSLTNSISLRVISGLSVSISGGYSFIHDQLSLRKEGATEEERLLRLREMATEYSFWTSFSITYTFGSIYSNIVNPIF